MRSGTRAAYLSAVAGLALGAHAQPITYPEVEPNDNKAQANVVAGLRTGDRLTGLTRGQLVGGGVNSPDYFLVSAAPAPLGIYRHQLDLISPMNGLFSTLRGLDQNAAGMIVPGGDVQVQSGATGTTLSHVWYGFGRAERVFMRIQGTATSQPYILSFSSVAAPVMQLSPALSAGNITILVEGTVGAPDAEIWVFDSNLSPIPGANNDDPAFPMSPTDSASLTRNYQGGTFYAMISLANAATHLSSPADEATPADDDVLDFAGAITPVGGISGAKFGNISFIDAQGTITLAQHPIQQTGRWYRFDVNPACTPAQIVQHPASLAAAVSQPVMLEVDATGSDPLSYQWRFNGTDIAGATQPAYSIPALTLGDAGSYTVIVANPCATVESNAAVLTVVPFEPQITGQPLPQTLCIGSTATFSVSASANLGGVLAYQWRHDGVPIPWAQASTYEFSITALADGGLYDCVVSESGLGQSTSSAALLTVKNEMPVLALIGPETLQIQVGQGPYQEQGATGSDDCDTSVSVACGGDHVNCNVPGLYTRTYDATDSQGNCAATMFRYVKVVDTAPPAVAMHMTYKALWPPFHKLINMGLTASTSGGGMPSTMKVRVFCDEPEAPPVGGCGNWDLTGFFSPDAKGFAPAKLRLRAERQQQGNGRVYLVMVTAKDAAGNTGFAFRTVVIPHWWSYYSWKSVNDQAAAILVSAKSLATGAATDQAVADGLAALGFVEHGKGPVRGPFQ